jgi:hypothetical protein
MPSVMILLIITNPPAEWSCFFHAQQEYAPNSLPENRSNLKGNYQE